MVKEGNLHAEMARETEHVHIWALPWHATPNVVKVIL